MQKKSIKDLDLTPGEQDIAQYNNLKVLNDFLAINFGSNVKDSVRIIKTLQKNILN